jgi:hypothetical protein
MVIGTQAGYEYNCIHTSASGDFYDLSPLSHCDSSGYTVNSDNDGAFVINFCNSVQAGCASGSSVCQMGAYSCGKAGSTTFSDISSGKGVVLKTTNGDGPCPNNVNRESVFTFICDTTVANDPQIKFVNENPQCSYNFEVRTKEACPKTTRTQKNICLINVFLVPHTHDDVGWLETVEGYYQSAVKHIIDTSLAALIANPTRKFIYVEQAYFTLWWNDPNTSDQQRAQMKQVVSEGRWEFIIGAWVMPDEACTTYGGIIDQMTLGHQFLLNTFGVRPNKGWQIDPFGASSVTPVLEKLAGFDAHLIDRITNKGQYENTRHLEFIWQGSPSLGSKGEIFSEIMGGGGYCDWLGAFNFDSDPVNPSNVATWGNKFANMAQQYAEWYKTPNVLAEWGCDFAFQNAAPPFHSMDQVVTWLQQNSQSLRMNVSYSVLSEYYDSVWAYAKANNVQWPNKDQGDYLPYQGGLWWTGYYTSRVELKGWVRYGEAVSHVVEPLYALGRISNSLNPNAYNQLTLLRKANGQAQHHDGVTGTSVPEVVDMYKNALIDGINAANQLSSNALGNIIKKGTSAVPSLSGGFAGITNITSGQTVALVLFNPLGWSRSDVVVLPVNRQDLTVWDSNQNKITSQTVTAVGGNITSQYHLFFQASIGALGYTTYFIAAPATDFKPVEEKINYIVEDTVLENSVLSVNISSSTNLISTITNKKSGVTVNVQQTLAQYRSQNSGAYAFGPAGPSFPVTTSTPTTTISRGGIADEVTTTFNSWAKQTIRLYHFNGQADAENFVEIFFTIGPLPSQTEVITIFNSNINSEGIVTTDDNGFEFLPREYQWGLGIEANYYPLIYASFISDLVSQLTVISERSHGVSSQIDGSIEVMIHRNPDMGDGFGPGLTDTTVVYPALRVLVDTPQSSIVALRRQSYLMNFPIEVFHAPTTSTNAWVNAYSTSGSFLSGDLPVNIHIASVNAVDGVNTKTAIVRLTHLFAIREDPKLSMPVSVTLSKLFTGVTVSAIMETTLSANTNIGTADTITISPKEIRTFVFTFA